MEVVSVAEATRMLGVRRARVYQLLDVGVLEAVDTEPVQIIVDGRSHGHRGGEVA